MERQQLLNQQQQRRLARKIHDDLSQKMTLLSLQLSMAATDDAPPADWPGTCQKWANLLLEAGQAVREIINDLQPRVNDERGLISALRWFAQTVLKSTSCIVTAPKDDICLAPFVANELFGICREVVADVLIPAKVKRIEIELQQDDELVRLLLRAGQGDFECLTESALEGLAVKERLQCFDGFADLGNSTLALSIPSNRPAVAAAA